MSWCLKPFCVALLCVAALWPVGLRAQDAAEAACRDHLQVLGAAYARYLSITEGKPPMRMSDLYSHGLVLDLDTFTCPASSNRITDAKQIDGLTAYEIATKLADEPPMLLFKDRHGFHEGQALAFYSDGTFRKAPAPRPATIVAKPPSTKTNDPATTQRPVTNASAAVVTNSDGTATLVLAEARQQAVALDFTGKEHYRNGRWVEAETAFREAGGRDPSSPWHPYNLALALGQQGRWKEAETFLRTSVRLEPGYGPAHLMLGRACSYQMNWSAAETAFQAAVKLETTNADYRVNLGAALRAGQKWPQAEAALRQASRLDPLNPQAHLELGHTFAGQGKWREAEAPYREALRLDPNNSWASGGIGHALLGQNRLAEAEAGYREAIRLTPGFAQFHADLAGALFRQGRRDEAKAAAQQGIRLGYRQHWVYRELGLGP